VGWKNAPASQSYQEVWAIDVYEPIEYDTNHNDVQWFMEHNFDYIFMLHEFESQIIFKYKLVKSYSQGSLYQRKL